jgi:hypothetical protein
MINLNTLNEQQQILQLQLRIHFLQHSLEETMKYVPLEKRDTLYWKLDEYSRQYWEINRIKKEK